MHVWCRLGLGGALTPHPHDWGWLGVLASNIRLAHVVAVSRRLTPVPLRAYA